MSVNYNTPTITNRLQAAENAMDGGGAAGVLRLLDQGNNPVSSLPLAFPAATVSGVVMTFNGLSLIDPSAVGGTATRARIEASNGTVVVSGLTVGTAIGNDIILSPTNVIGPGQVVAIQQATITGT